MNLSFVIVNYRSKKYLEECISSVFEFGRGVDFEIIVVNNDRKKLTDFLGNEPGFLKKVENIRGVSQKIKIIEVNENIGFGRACNLGAKEASGEVLCFLNPDTEIISENMNDVLQEFENDPKVGIIGPKIVEKDGKIQKWIAGEELSLWRILKNNLGFEADKKIWLANKKREVAWVTGAVLFIRKSLFEKIKGFDEKFFMYFEDVDLCKRARLKDFKVLYFPKFTVRHLGGGSAKNHTEQKKEYYKSQNYYFEKWFGKSQKQLLVFLRNLQGGRWFV